MTFNTATENAAFTVDFNRNPRYMLGRTPLLGVTDVLRDCGLINATYYTDEGRQRGKVVHAACHYADEDALDWQSLHPDLHGYVHSWLRLRERLPGLQIMEIERARFHPLFMFAGTLDRRVFYNGFEHVWDVKTGPAPRWGRLQTAAYDLLLPPYERGLRKRAAVELHEDGSTATMRPHEDLNDGNYFLAMVATVRARQQSGVSSIDATTGECTWKQNQER